jgi:Secretion system C-terminal sorting domain
MKKVYSVMLILFALWAPSVNAQVCPNANAIAYIGASSCWVTIQNAVPNGQITIEDPNGQLLSPLPAPFTNASGNALVFYNCNFTPSLVTVVLGTQACLLAVPSATNLPIKIKSFTAQSQNDKTVMLRWTSVFEANSSKFIIQKSLDGRNFSDISEVRAAGNSSAAKNYSFIDRQMAEGAAYYRLKLMDIDGTVDFTKIVYINNGKVSSAPLSIFPNPFTSEVQLKGVSSSDVNRKNIKIYNSVGMEVNYRVLSGNAINIDPSLPKGVYILRVKGETFKLFKK